MNFESHDKDSFDYRFLAAELETQLDRMVKQATSRALAELPEQWMADRPELRVPLEDAARAAFQEELESFAAGLVIPQTCPPALAEMVRTQAEVGAGVEPTHWGLRVGHQCLWESWVPIVHELSLDDRRRRMLLALTSDFFFEYTNVTWSFVKNEYETHRERVLRTSDQRRVQIVHQLLAGEDVDTAGLGYDLDNFHLALIAWGPGAVLTGRALAERSGRELLSVPLPHSSVYWIWLGGERTIDDQAVDSLEVPENTFVAVGEDCEGLVGFKRSHEMAGYAHRAGRACNQQITRFRDTELEVLASRNERDARVFIERELDGFNEDDRRSAALRDTLSAYFESGHNAAAAAAALGVHEQTVANRLKAVTELIGDSVNARRCELETAIRLRRFLS